jgi:hypothetical protein
MGIKKKIKKNIIFGLPTTYPNEEKKKIDKIVNKK